MKNPSESPPSILRSRGRSLRSRRWTQRHVACGLRRLFRLLLVREARLIAGGGGLSSSSSWMYRRPGPADLTVSGGRQLQRRRARREPLCRSWALGPLALGFLGSLARSLKRVFCVGLALVSSGFTGSGPALAVSGPAPPPASSVRVSGAVGKRLARRLAKADFFLFAGLHRSQIGDWRASCPSSSARWRQHQTRETRLRWGDFCRKPRALSRKRVRSTFLFFFGAGGA